MVGGASCPTYILVGKIHHAVADPLPNAGLGKESGIMQYIELSPVAGVGYARLHARQG